MLSTHRTLAAVALGSLAGEPILAQGYTTYGLGCAAHLWLLKKNGERWMGDTLVPVAAGFIIGEALTSLGVVLYQLLAG